MHYVNHCDVQRDSPAAPEHRSSPSNFPKFQNSIDLKLSGNKFKSIYSTYYFLLEKFENFGNLEGWKKLINIIRNTTCFTGKSIVFSVKMLEKFCSKF